MISTRRYFVTNDAPTTELCFKYVVTSDGNIINLLEIKETRSLMIGSEYDRAYCVLCLDKMV